MLVFLTSGYFQTAHPGWSDNSQFGLTCAIVEHHTLSIDAYHNRPETRTNDKAFFDGHFYCDKSPVTSLLGVPALFLYRTAAEIFEFDISYASARHWTTWGSVGLSAGVLVWLLTILLERRGVESWLAAILAGLWFLATPLLGYAILFFSYLPACAFAVGGFMLAESWLENLQWRRLSACDLAGETPAPLRRNVSLLAAGFLMGLSAWTLQTFALLAVIVTTGLLAKNPPRQWIKLWPWALGGLIGVSGYAIYGLAIFGKIASPYRFEADPYFQENMKRGLMGATWPDPLVLLLITFHPFHGLFALFPATISAALGLFLSLGRKQARVPALVALAFLVGLLLYNSGYYMWWGGWGYAPRHLIPALPLMVLGFAPWAKGRRVGSLGAALFWLTVAVTIFSAMLNASVVALDPQLPPNVEDEFLRKPASVEHWPHPFFDALNYVREGQTDPNWGTRFGLHGFWSLLPLAVIWAIGIAWLWRQRERESDSDG